MTPHLIVEKQECPFKALERYRKDLNNTCEFWNAIEKYNEALVACSQFVRDSDPYRIDEYGSVNIRAFNDSG